MKRMRFWNTQLSSFGKIQTVKYNNLPSDIELGENVEKMITNTRMEVVDMHVSLVFLQKMFHTFRSNFTNLIRILYILLEVEVEVVLLPRV